MGQTYNTRGLYREIKCYRCKFEWFCYLIILLPFSISLTASLVFANGSHNSRHDFHTLCIELTLSQALGDTFLLKDVTHNLILFCYCHPAGIMSNLLHFNKRCTIAQYQESLFPEERLISGHRNMCYTCNPMMGLKLTHFGAVAL